MTRLSQRINRVKMSPTIKMAMQANQLKQAGKIVYNLTVGEPDFDTPDPIKLAASAAIQSGKTKYTPVGGTPALKAAIVAKLQRENTLSYEPTQILVSCGAKHSLYNAFQVLLDPGDTVLIPAPYWVSYPDMVLLAEGTPHILPTKMETGLKVTPNQLAQAITDKTRLFILNTPSNPSGICYHPDELRALGEVLAQHPHVWIMTDDIYEHIYWGKTPLAHLLQVCPQLADRTLLINGVSKAYAMTGWRIGYTAGPQPVIAAMQKLQSQSTSNPNSIAQAAATAALNGGLETVYAMTHAFEQRYHRMQQAIQALPGFSCLETEGTFYLFPHVKAAMRAHGIENDMDFASYLIETIQVVTVPGSAFGTPDHLRFSFATDDATLKTALEKMHRLFNA